MYLGTNVLSDYRECVMVGAEQNTTDTIATHDVYGEGEFKDDQIQNHRHSITPYNMYNASDYWTGQGIGIGNNGTTVHDTLTIRNVIDARTGDTDTTHGKQKAVYVYIKATSGLAENQQENVLNDVKGYVDSSIDKTHPTIDLSKVFSKGTLNVYILYNTYGAGRYVLLGQGSHGHAASTIDICTLVSNAVVCLISSSYNNLTSNVINTVITESNQTVVINDQFIDNANYMKKVCSFI